MVSLNRCYGSSNTLDDVSSRICIPNKTDKVNLYILNIITRINESITLTKHILSNSKCKFDRSKFNTYQK